MSVYQQKQKKFQLVWKIFVTAGPREEAIFYCQVLSQHSKDQNKICLQKYLLHLLPKSCLPWSWSFTLDPVTPAQCMSLHCCSDPNPLIRGQYDQ